MLLVVDYIIVIHQFATKLVQYCVNVSFRWFICLYKIVSPEHYACFTQRVFFDKTLDFGEMFIGRESVETGCHAVVYLLHPYVALHAIVPEAVALYRCRGVGLHI